MKFPKLFLGLPLACSENSWGKKKKKKKPKIPTYISYNIGSPALVPYLKPTMVQLTWP
jgi:hypothetical protein